MYEVMDSNGRNNVSITGLLALYNGKRYPGRKILENGLKMLKTIVEINDVKAFFNELQDRKEDLLDYEEDVQDVKKFFANQRDIFDKAVQMLDIFEDNKSYVNDRKMLDIVEELERITSSKQPYSEIHLLPDLIRDFRNCFGELLERESEPIRESIEQDKELTLANAEENGLVEEYGANIRDSFGALGDRIEEANNFYRVIAMRTESDRLKQRLVEKMQEDLYRREKKKQAQEIKGQEVKKIPVRKAKTVSMRSLFEGRTQITSAAEIDYLVSEVERRLKAELDENTTIHIV